MERTAPSARGRAGAPAMAVTKPEVLAREKLARVFGAAHADRHLMRLLGEMGIDALTTMEELDRFAQWLKARGGIEAASARPSRRSGSCSGSSSTRRARKRRDRGRRSKDRARESAFPHSVATDPLDTRRSTNVSFFTEDLDREILPE